MTRRKLLYSYVLRRLARDTRGHFTNELESRTLPQFPRKLAELEARESSRAHRKHLVTLSRNGVILSHLINGRAVHPEAIVADAARALQS